MSKKSMSMKMPVDVIEWLDKNRNGIPRTKFMSSILSQLFVEFNKDGKPIPKIKKGK